MNTNQSYRNARNAIYDEFHYEMEQIEEQYKDGMLSQSEYMRYRSNLEQNIETDLRELKNGID